MAEIQKTTIDHSVTPPTTNGHAPSHHAAPVEPTSDASTTVSTAAATASSQPRSRPPKPPINQIYSQPAPLRVLPFPTLTSNPVSWLHLAVTWLAQTFYPPPAEPSVIHTAYWDVSTRSIIVTDEKSMAALWQQGFYGKGSLSRSEPNWLRREEIRQGIAQGRVAEVNTDKRREERARAKWERARAEEEARVQRRLDEARLKQAVAESAAAAAVAVPVPVVGQCPAPVGPLELLALPNSLAEPVARKPRSPGDSVYTTGVSPLEESASSGNDDADSHTTVSSDSTGLKRRKSVRFSPDVVSTVFQHTDPPSPPRSVSSASLKSDTPDQPPAPEPVALDSQATAAEAVHATQVTLVNKEHLQLPSQEAFFLVFALGALRVVDAATQATIPTPELLTMFRQLSYYPPRTPEALEPDDPFLISYAVYHHFRSLGWVPRGGVKFGVDWLLYTRGPVFDHAEYGLLVLPSYAHPYWKAEGREAPRKTWHWLMGVNRVLSKVYKSLVLIYVDIPPPSAFAADGVTVGEGGGLPELLKQYRIREYMVKRWSSNRNRDSK